MPIDSNAVEESKDVERKTAGTHSVSTIETLVEHLDPDEIDMFAERVYEKYASAMEMRGRKPLERVRFKHHFFDGGNVEQSLAFGSGTDGYLFGSQIEDIFIPTHFAPESLKGGYRLIKDLIASGVPVALFITEDLVETITKMEGWKVFPIKLKARFSGEIVEKTLVVNRWNVVPKLVMHEVGRIARENIAQASTKLQGFGEKVTQLFTKLRANTDEMDQEVHDAIVEAELESQSEIAKLKQDLLRHAKLFDDEAND